ncbi:hypothetical protein ACLKA6_008415 [Drosophila palustris]
MVPLEYIRFNFYRQRDRCLMMLSVQSLDHQLMTVERPMIFEFGGHIHKQSQVPRRSSSDVHVEEEVHHVQVHVPRSPNPSTSLCCSSAGGA